MTGMITPPSCRRHLSGGRQLAVLSVDGVNAVSGETAAARQSGYVLGPWQSAEIRGWRKSLEDVAAFYFTALPDAYAARTRRMPQRRCQNGRRNGWAPVMAGG